MGLVNDIANGKADPSRMMSYLGGVDSQFWKGAVVGIGATLLLTNDSVKGAMAGLFSSLLGGTGGRCEEDATDPAAEGESHA